MKDHGHTNSRATRVHVEVQELRAWFAILNCMGFKNLSSRGLYRNNDHIYGCQFIKWVMTTKSF